VTSRGDVKVTAVVWLIMFRAGSKSVIEVLGVERLQALRCVREI
jgi:hypothetical protein